MTTTSESAPRRPAAIECAEFLGRLLAMLDGQEGQVLEVDLDEIDEGRAVHRRYLEEQQSPPLPEPKPCKAAKCTRRLVFAADEEHGRSLPIDVSTPVYMVYRRADGRVVASRLEGAGHRRLGVLHYATCADPERFRKGGRS